MLLTPLPSPSVPAVRGLQVCAQVPCLSPACLLVPTFLQPCDHNRRHYTFLAWQPMV